MYVYINGDVVHKDEARISPFDHGFLYGLGVFETFRTQADEIFVTNSIQEIVPIYQMNGRTYPGADGIVTSFLQRYYKRFTPFLWTRHELAERIE
ncbi:MULTISPECIES: hypothetical protein [Bacillaceae]|uniref:Aminodeoxychorismate lyase n=1 Tax=Parageobacillus toebii TaxID=153151 RepID=A0A150N6J9_9BACL|nr:MULTISPECIES: hypothetical protein [Bacillaceae]KYD32329.1 Aminodeoxychorismate lyase [Parageobacillus toebii]